MLRICLLHIDELSAWQPLEDWLTALPPEMQRDILAYRKPDDRWRVLAGKLLLRYVLEREGIDSGLSAVRCTEKGRLYLPDTGFDFNISHSGRYTVLAATSSGPCGIDIEVHRKVDIESFRRLFTAGEWEAITGASDPLRVFFKCWAIKESVIKADGRGVEILGRTEIQSDNMAVCDGKEWHIRSLALADGYSACICWHKELPETISMERVGAELLKDLISLR